MEDVIQQPQQHFFVNNIPLANIASGTGNSV
jgi:hypothetical protein